MEEEKGGGRNKDRVKLGVELESDWEWEQE